MVLNPLCILKQVRHKPVNFRTLNSLKVKFRNLLMFIYILLTVRLLIASQEINSPEFLSFNFTLFITHLVTWILR